MASTAAALALLSLGVTLSSAAPPAPPGDEVRIGISTRTSRQIRILQEAFRGEGDRGAGAGGVTADGILYNDLDLSGLFSVTRGWSKDERPFDVQAVIEPRLKISGSRVTVAAEIKDFPARRAIGRSQYEGPTSSLRRLVHRLADDVVFQLTGERGIAETQIAFAAGSNRGKELYVVDYDGFGARALTKGGIALSPSWAADGSAVAFSWLGSKGWSIFRVPSGGGKAVLLRGSKGLNSAPAYSPDGSSLAFSSSFEGNSEIYVMPTAGGAPRRLTKNNAIDTAPAWAPNGQRIAFTSDRGGSPQIYVMDADGGNARRLVYGLSYTDSPDWSPKGDRLAFVVRSGGGFDIYTVDAAGQDPRQLVTGGINLNPRWSPDGRHLVFSSNRQGGRGIFVVDADGVRVRRLDVPGPEAKTPAWSPRPGGAATAIGLR